MNKLAAYLFVTLVALGLASAQINFSTGWGKRSASHHPASDGAFITRHPSDEKYLSDEKLSDDADVNSGLDRCRSLVKSLGLISLIAQTEMLGLDKYARSGQSLASDDAEASASGRA